MKLCVLLLLLIAYRETQAGWNKDECYLKPDAGVCRSYLERWAYNSPTDSCELFVYGGCGGNGNNFETKDECEKGCVTDICHLSKVVGPRRAAIPRWWYNSAKDRCELFSFGGCRGNENNFETESECDAACTKDPCKYELDVGEGGLDLKRWAYDSDTDSCKPFHFGGSGGNPNNFYWLYQCSNKCVKDRCNLLIDSGPCDGHIERWGYCFYTHKCRKFVYGGCEGNANNFKSEHACKKACGASE